MLSTKSIYEEKDKMTRTSNLIPLLFVGLGLPLLAGAFLLLMAGAGSGSGATIHVAHQTQQQVQVLCVEVPRLAAPEHITRDHTSADAANKLVAWNNAMASWTGWTANGGFDPNNRRGPTRCYVSKAGRLLVYFADVVFKSASGSVYEGVALILNGGIAGRPNTAMYGLGDPASSKPGWFDQSRTDDPFLYDEVDCSDLPPGFAY